MLNPAWGVKMTFEGTFNILRVIELLNKLIEDGELLSGVG